MEYCLIESGGNWCFTATQTATIFIIGTGTSSGGLFGDALGDTYLNIENLTGSAFQDIWSATTASMFSMADLVGIGGAGNDTLVGGAGADSLVGSEGVDIASYATALAGVTASLATPSVNTGDAAGDSYGSIENLTGGNFNDTLIGDANANVLDSGAGKGGDTLTGGAGNDTFVFRVGFGRDTITDFAAGQDAIELHDGLFASADAAFAAARQTGADVTITIDAANSILLHDVALANLHASDFHVV